MEKSAVLDTQQSYHHGNLRQELVEKALDQLKQVGPDKVSLRALAREIGVSQTAPYRHFSDKNALLAAIAAQGYNELNRVTIKACGDCRDAPEKMIQAGLAYILFARQNPELYKLMFGPVIECPLEYPDLAEAGQASFQVILAICEEGVQAGLFTNQDASLIAHSTWAMVHGIASLWIDGMYQCTGRQHDDSLITDSLKLALHGVLKRDGD
ncbi:TetR family transcriptional regulator [Hahella sp. CCB-MM4]|uniref:TetR/AcrR family transcriptional regulator n=1 Tax=Hahella sp. (strain CCB-MM4) TaxID=1926491 RepID=UPI000B9AFAF1|nr:TetR/AcrR family transcriptional regulator [Hahella sp. CCB-MM4]OZG70782.1 TetR family transcriptional regulator [Hahella sp. CCB-MM4]